MNRSRSTPSTHHKRRLAGENDLTDKVRPSLNRRGETRVKPADDEVPASSDEAVGAGGESPVEAE